MLVVGGDAGERVAGSKKLATVKAGRGLYAHSTQSLCSPRREGFGELRPGYLQWLVDLQAVVVCGEVVMQSSVSTKRLVLGIVDVRAPLEVRQQVVESVTLIVDLACPFIVRAIGSSVPKHKVECAGTSESFSTSIVNAAVSESRLRSSDEAPIDQR